MANNKLLKIGILFFGLSLLTEAYADKTAYYTSTRKRAYLREKIDDSKHSVSWSESNVTFTFSGPDNNIYAYGLSFYLTNGHHFFLLGIPMGDNTGSSYTISWSVNDRYDIEVTNVTLDVMQATVRDSYITVGDVTSNDLGKGDLLSNLISSGSRVYTNTESVPITFGPAFASSNVDVNSVSITYRLIEKFVFDGSGGGSETERKRWDKTANWKYHVVPTIKDRVYIEHDAVIANEVAAEKMIIEGDNQVTVAPEGELTIGVDGIKNATKDNLKLEAGTTGVEKGKTGSLRIDPAYTGAMPNATVEMYSIAYFDMGSDNIAERNNDASWQYVGSPMTAGAAAKSVFEKSWCYNWDEAAGAWKNNRKNLVLKPFEGYATSQYTSDAGLLITYTGQLASNKDVSIPLTYNGSGANVLANSYAAPIDITRMQTSDFDHAEATIYLFNTGSKNDVKTASSNTDPGQYVAIPINLAGTGDLPAVIPSLQGFYVQANTPGVSGSLKLNYERMVWSASNGNTALRAPQQSSETDKNTLCLALNAGGWGDRLLMIESEDYSPEFENGYDAHKMMSGNLNIFSIEGTDSLAVDATSSIIGARIGVRTGDETAYTMVFSRVNSAEELALLDEETSEMVDIDEGTEYTFFAEPNSILSNRFRIIARSKAITTGLDKASGDSKVQKFMRGNELFILKNGVLYNVMGTIVQK